MEQVEVTEFGELATQTKHSRWSLITTGDDLTAGLHYWEVEFAGNEMAGIFVGVSRPGAEPRTDHVRVDDEDALVGDGLHDVLELHDPPDHAQQKQRQLKQKP